MKDYSENFNPVEPSQTLSSYDVNGPFHYGFDSKALPGWPKLCKALDRKLRESLVSETKSCGAQGPQAFPDDPWL